MPPTPFPAGKTIKELGIDTTRKFVVVDPDVDSVRHHVKKGLVLELQRDDGSEAPWFKDENGEIYVFCLSELAYYEPTEQEEWEPKVGDEVAIKGDIVQITKAGSIHISTGDRIIYSVPPQALKFLSRPPAPRKVTMKEVNEKFGETVEIVD